MIFASVTYFHIYALTVFQRLFITWLNGFLIVEALVDVIVKLREGLFPALLSTLHMHCKYENYML